MADLIETQSAVVVTRKEALARGLKRCSGCHDWHPVDRFGPNKATSDGLSAMCRESTREIDRRNHARRRGDAYTPRVCEAVKAEAPDGQTWCNIHKRYCPTENFGKDGRKANGLQSSCTRAQYEAKAEQAGRKRRTSKHNPPPPGTKWCSWHKRYEPIGGFGRQSTKNRKDGLVSMCLDGKRAYSRTKNPSHAAKERNRRAKKRGNGGRHTGEEIVALGNRQGWLCGNPLCRVDIRLCYDADHIMPLARKGSDDISNIWLTCPSCNRKKSDAHPVQWAQSLGLDPAALWPHLTFDKETT